MDMSQRFWVVGGDYEGDRFDRIVPGTERMVGPYGNREDAELEWRRMTFCDRNPSTRRFTIAVDGGAR